jgi:hypothetical protein
MATATVHSLDAAGATLTGSVALTRAWTDPTQATVLAGISTRLAATPAPADQTAAVQAAGVLAGALLTRSPSAVGVSSTATTALLAGLQAGGFVVLSGHPDEAASALVLLLPSRLPAYAVSSFAPLLAAAHAAGTGTLVLGATGSGDPRGSLTQLRGTAGLARQVSMVDTADIAAGQFAAVLALAQQVAGGVGQYGDGVGTTPLPPTPSASPSAAPAGG